MNLLFSVVLHSLLVKAHSETHTNHCKVRFFTRWAPRVLDVLVIVIIIKVIVIYI